MTDKPFGVNLTFLPTVSSPDYPGYVDAIIDGGVRIVETAGRNPQEHLPKLQAAGAKIIHKCTSVRHALKAQAIADGMITLRRDGLLKVIRGITTLEEVIKETAA